MTPTLIGLNGKARSGKDTTADFIQAWCNNHEFTSSREAFAKRLKKSAAHALGVFENEVEFCNKLKGDYERAFISVHMATPESGPNTQVAKVTGREFLQYYGTESHREVFGSDFWVDAVLPTTEGKLGAIYKEEKFDIDKTMASSTPIPDWHQHFYRQDQPTVADYCLITDVRFPNEAERIKELGGVVWKIIREGSGAGNHSSEQELDGELIDLVIDNNGSLEDLEASVAVSMEDISGITFAEQSIANEFVEEI